MEIGKNLWEDVRRIKQKGLKLTTLAIIGSGIMGSSLLYNLTLERSSFDAILVFDSEAFALPCSKNSTAIVAPRGVTSGHSPLGDMILDSYLTFKEHVLNDRPAGIFQIPQYTGTEEKLEQFKLRYPDGEHVQSIGKIPLKRSVYFTTEEAFLIDPDLYLNWLQRQAKNLLPIQEISEFVTEVKPGEKIKITTQSLKEFQVDHVIFATGSYTRFWKNLFPESKLKTAKAIQGAYYEFQNVTWSIPSFSLTFEGMNLIYHAHSRKLLIGSTTDEFTHSLHPARELSQIKQRLSGLVDLELPEIGKVRLAHREKASKREPYLFTEGNMSFMGGVYKNGFSFSLKMTRSLSHQLRERA